MTSHADAPGLVVPPPVIYLPAVVLGFVTDWLWPVELLPDRLQYVLGGVLIVLSLMITLWVLREFARAGTHFDEPPPTFNSQRECAGAPTKDRLVEVPPD